MDRLAGGRSQRPGGAAGAHSAHKAWAGTFGPRPYFGFAGPLGPQNAAAPRRDPTLSPPLRQRASASHTAVGCGHRKEGADMRGAAAFGGQGGGPAGRPQLVEKPPGVRGPQCSSQRSRCVGPWGLPGAPLLTGLPPRSSRHWRRSALPSGGFDRIWRHKVNCPEGTREVPPGGVRQIRKKPCVARVSRHRLLAAP